LRGIVCDVHGRHWGAIEAEEVQTGDVVEWVDLVFVALFRVSNGSESSEVCKVYMYLEKLGLIVVRIDGAVVVAWIRHELSAVHRYWAQEEGAIREFLESAMLPLHYRPWALRINSYRWSAPLLVKESCDCSEW